MRKLYREETTSDRLAHRIVKECSHSGRSNTACVRCVSIAIANGRHLLRGDFENELAIAKRTRASLVAAAREAIELGNE